MSQPLAPSEAIRSAFLREGFSVVRYTSPVQQPDIGARLEHFLSDGRHASMDWMAERVHERSCPHHLFTAADFADMENLAPLGRLAPGFYPVIDPLDKSDPDLGELLLGGGHVGSGYYNDPESTAAAFVQDPMEPNYRKIVYRTGDLVQRDAQGMLHFKGRVDNQVKHMGYRIELEEIEAAFNALDAVQEVGVVYQRDALGTGSIQAFVMGTADDQQLRTAVAQRLPHYMMPRKIHLLPVLPKNANGKIDRQQLKALCS